MGRLDDIAALGYCWLSRCFIIEIFVGDGASELTHYFIAVLKNMVRYKESLWGVKDKKRVNPTTCDEHFSAMEWWHQRTVDDCCKIVLANNESSFREI